MLAQPLDRLGHLGILKMSGAINEEEVFPRLALARTRLNLRHVDLELAERGNGLVQRARLVGHAQHQTRAIITRRRTALTAEHEKARGIRRIVLDVLRQNFQTVFFRCQHATERGRKIFLRGKLGGARIGRRLDDLHTWQIFREPATTLCE